LGGQTAGTRAGPSEDAYPCEEPRISVVGFCSEWGAAITAALRDGYERSPTVRSLVGTWLTRPARTIVVEHVPGVCRARVGCVEFDAAVAGDASLRREPGRMRDEERAALLYELARALSQAGDAGTRDCVVGDLPPPERVLAELGLPTPFASIAPETMAVGELTYEGRWRGMPPCGGHVRRVPGSNVLYLPSASVPPVQLRAGKEWGHRPSAPPVTAALLATVDVETELTSDLLSAPPVDLQALGPGRRSWPWHLP
jgi:hypothetical protein